MISTHDSAYKVTDQVFFSCVNIIHRAGIGAIIAEAHRKHHGSGGTAPSMPVHLGCGTGGGSLHHPRGQGALNGRNL